MSFSINTNITSLDAQYYLQQTSNFQHQTINQVTSGLRIVQSGDDAAGLAIANGYRSNEAVLTQGIQNATDGLSQLQIVDGGMSNISQLLDQARTLATESASGTFTGDRTVLNLFGCMPEKKRAHPRICLLEHPRTERILGHDGGEVLARRRGGEAELGW